MRIAIATEEEPPLVQVIRTERKGNVLRPPRVPCSVTHGIDLTAGCAHECLYCYGRGYEIYPGDGRLKLYADTSAKLRCELARKKKRPVGVSFSAYSDPFQPVLEVLDAAYEVMAYLLERQVPVSILTKGRIPLRHMELLCEHSRIVHVRIGLVTLDQQIVETFEPNCAPPEGRLAQLEELTRRGVATGVRMDPILPGLTDDVDSLERLCSAIAKTGTEWIAPSVLFLRPPILLNLKRRLLGTPALGRLMDNFRDAVRLPIHDGDSVVTVPSAERRRAIYERVRAAARRHGLHVRLCSCKNSDLTSDCCTGLPEWLSGLPKTRQISLFPCARQRSAH